MYLSAWKQVVKVIWYTAASPTCMDGSIVFVTWRQCAPSSNTCFLGLWALMCQRNHVLDWVQILMGRGNIGGKGRPLESIRTVCRELCKNVWSDRDAVCDAESSGPKEPCIRWGPDSPWEGAILRGRARPDDTLTWAVQKRVNRSSTPCVKKCSTFGLL